MALLAERDYSRHEMIRGHIAGEWDSDTLHGSVEEEVCLELGLVSPSPTLPSSEYRH